MPHVDNRVQLNTRASAPRLSRPVVPHWRTRATRQPNPLPATPRPAGTLAMQWSTGPDGRLRCAWIPSEAGRPDWLQPRADREREPMREAMAAYRVASRERRP